MDESFFQEEFPIKNAEGKIIGAIRVSGSSVENDPKVG